MAKALRKNLLGLILLAALLWLLSVLYRQAYKRFYQTAYPLKYEALITQCSEQNGVPLSLSFAVVRSESDFRPEAVSSIGARGLMQITEPAFEWALFRSGTEEKIDFDQLFDPEINVRYGTFILSLLLQEFEDERTALCAYHAGWGIVKQWLQDPEYSNDGRTLFYIPYADTRAYVQKVMETKTIYENLYEKIKTQSDGRE